MITKEPKIQSGESLDSMLGSFVIIQSIQRTEGRAEYKAHPIGVAATVGFGFQYTITMTISVT